MYGYNDKPVWPKILFGVLAILVVILLCGGWSFVPERLAVDHISGQIVNTYVKTEGDNGVFYAVVQKDDGSTEVLQDTDALWQGKWNSSDVYVQLTDAQKNNQHVTLVVTGWRVPFLSMYRDIITIQSDGSQ